MEQRADSEPNVHVVFLPYPAQGHIKPMLKLAQLLITIQPNVHVTFVNTQQNHDLLLLSSDFPSIRRRYPNLQLLSYRHDTPVFGYSGASPEKLSENEFLEYALLSVRAAAKPALKELLVSLMEKSREQHDQRPPPPPTCIVADWVIMASCAVDVAKEFENYDIPVFAFQTCCAYYMWLDFHNLKLIEQGQVPLRDKDMDKAVTSISGLENVFRRRDLSGFCRLGQVCKQLVEISTNYGFSAVSEALHGLILNTFDQLEAPIISNLNSFFPNKIYTVGPLHALLNNASKDASASTDNGILFKEDRSCIAWLDSQPSRSVVYVSFGSLASLSRTQILEFGNGLVNSGKPFLWVIRPNSISVEKNEDGSSPTQVLTELESMSKGKGLMVEWAPQEMVLAHRAIGGFLTHCGWNSVLESIYANVPMICWSTGVDQHVNSRCVSEVWKVGFDMKDTCDRLIVEKMVKDVMEDKRDEVMKSMDKISKLAQESVLEGGSSYCNLEKLIARIQSLVPSACKNDKPQNK